MDQAAALLRRHRFLVFHQRPGLTRDGTWVSAVEYDGAGFPDLVALRPGCPAIFVEVKTDSAVSKDQRDWLEAGAGDGRLCAVLRPAGWKAFVEHVRLLTVEYPSPPSWSQTLANRAWRHETKRAGKRLARTIKKEGKVPATMTTTMKLPHNTPVTLGAGKTVYLYRGHGSDGSVCVYGPVTWDGSRERWAAAQRAKFHCKITEIKEVKR
jgi:hypothetical protein